MLRTEAVEAALGDLDHEEVAVDGATDLLVGDVLELRLQRCLVRQPLRRLLRAQTRPRLQNSAHTVTVLCKVTDRDLQSEIERERERERYKIVHVVADGLQRVVECDEEAVVELHLLLVVLRLLQVEATGRHKCNKNATTPHNL